MLRCSHDRLIGVLLWAAISRCRRFFGTFRSSGEPTTACGWAGRAATTSSASAHTGSSSTPASWRSTMIAATAARAAAKVGNSSANTGIVFGSFRPPLPVRPLVVQRCGQFGYLPGTLWMWIWRWGLGGAVQVSSFVWVDAARGTSLAIWRERKSARRFVHGLPPCPHHDLSARPRRPCRRQRVEAEARVEPSPAATSPIAVFRFTCVLASGQGARNPLIVFVLVIGDLWREGCSFRHTRPWFTLSAMDRGGAHCYASLQRAAAGCARAGDYLSRSSSGRVSCWR